MTTIVLKHDGSKQPFDEKKIARAVRLAAEEAKVSADALAEAVNVVLKAVAERLGDRAEVATRDIRSLVLDTLDIDNKSIADAWRAYDKKMGKPA